MSTEPAPLFASFAITALTNARDGIHASVQTESTPTGGATYYAARTPITPEDKRVRLAATIEDGVVRLAFPLPGAWFVWGHDNRGWTRGISAVHIGISDRAELEELGYWLRDTVRTLCPLLDATLKEVWGTGRGPTPVTGIAGGSPTALSPEIKEVVFGASSHAGSYPAIIIHRPDWQEPYGGSNYLRNVTASMDITIMYVRADGQTNVLPGFVRLMRRLQSMMNLDAYERIALPSGYRFSFCNTTLAIEQEDFVAGIGWVSEATLRWSGQTTSQHVTGE